MTKGINHPANLWLNAEFVVQESMTHVHVEDQVLVIGARLIGRSPAALRDLQLPIVNQSLDAALLMLIQLSVPHVEIFHFHIRKCSSWIPLQLINQRVKNILNCSSLIVNNI